MNLRAPDRRRRRCNVDAAQPVPSIAVNLPVTSVASCGRADPDAAIVIDTLRPVPSDFPYGPDTALVVVDVQNDFADPQGSLHVPGGPEVVAVVNEEVAAARAGGAKLAYTADWHPPSTPHFVLEGGPWPVHCVGGTWGAAFHPDLDVAGEVVRKGTGGEDGYSGFTVRHPTRDEAYATHLGAVLHAAGVRRVVVVGLATDYCVKETALDGVQLGFDTTVLRRAVAAVDVHPGDGESALAEMAAAGVHVV